MRKSLWPVWNLLLLTGVLLVQVAGATGQDEEQPIPGQLRQTFPRPPHMVSPKIARDGLPKKASPEQSSVDPQGGKLLARYIADIGKSKNNPKDTFRAVLTLAEINPKMFDPKLKLPLRIFATGQEIEKKPGQTVDVVIPYRDVVEVYGHVIQVQLGSVVFQVITHKDTSVDPVEEK
jgi:hypothetical protein